MYQPTTPSRPRTKRLRVSHTGCLSIVLLVCFLALGTGRSFGQTFTSSLTGVLSDRQGAVVPNVEVEIRNSATNDTRTAKTGPERSYVFSNLLPGTYELTAKMQGFKTFVRRNITLLPGRSSQLDVALELGEVTATVEVTESAVLLDTRSADNTATLTTTLVAQLPTNTRSPLNFVFAMAGTTEGAMGAICQHGGPDVQHLRPAGRPPRE